MSGMHRNRIDQTKKEKRHGRFRLLFQLASAALFNGYAAGFMGERLYTGKSKLVCVPVLNCYSCPGALGSCPIGSLQAVAGGARHRISFYVLGTLMLFGCLLGRLICGFLCPFGLLQDLLCRIPVKKRKVPKKADRTLRLLKYIVLLLFVFLLPALAVNEFGIAPPYFCQYICPAGTLEGGIPQLLMDAQLRSLAGALWNWKAGLLLFFLTGSMFISRFFCRYFCPLGAFYSLFNRFSCFQMHLDPSKCIRCGRCEQACPMDIEVTADINSPECIRCGRCRAACPQSAIRSGFLK